MAVVLGAGDVAARPAVGDAGQSETVLVRHVAEARERHEGWARLSRRAGRLLADALGAPLGLRLLSADGIAIEAVTVQRIEHLR